MGYSVSNSGTLGSTGSSGLTVNSAAANSGLIWADARMDAQKFRSLFANRILQVPAFVPGTQSDHCPPVPGRAVMRSEWRRSGDGVDAASIGPSHHDIRPHRRTRLRRSARNYLCVGLPSSAGLVAKRRYLLVPTPLGGREATPEGRSAFRSVPLRTAGSRHQGGWQRNRFIVGPAMRWC